jgi:hypothetical protein
VLVAEERATQLRWKSDLVVVAVAVAEERATQLRWKSDLVVVAVAVAEAAVLPAARRNPSTLHCYQKRETKH